MKSRNERANADDEFFALEVVIVDDNAQLTKENRIQNSLSFASSVTGSSSHLSSRWCSQPVLQSSCNNNQTMTTTTATCTRRSSLGSNACWDDDRRFRSSIAVPLLASSRSNCELRRDQEQVGQSNKSSAPICPSRGKSSQYFGNQELLDRKSSSKITRNSSSGSEAERSFKLRNALGSMAPSSTLSTLSTSSLLLESSLSSKKQKSPSKGTRSKNKRGELAVAVGDASPSGVASLQSPLPQQFLRP